MKSKNYKVIISQFTDSVPSDYLPQLNFTQ